MKPVLLLHSNPYGSKERKKLIYGDRTEQNKRLAVYKRLPLHLFNTSGRFHLGMVFLVQRRRLNRFVRHGTSLFCFLSLRPVVERRPTDAIKVKKDEKESTQLVENSEARKFELMSFFFFFKRQK